MNQIEHTNISEKIKTDLLKPINFNKKFHAWMAFLTISLAGCLYAYFLQLRDGLEVTGMRDYVSWGIYIANFVFFVAASLVGMLISSVLGLIGKKWIIPITRISEIIAVAFAAVAGLVIIFDMGRPDRFLNVLIHGRLQSPILWDVTVVTTYLIISVLLLFIPLLPDISIALENKKYLPKFLIKIYKLISLNWKHTNKQYEILHKSIHKLLIIVIPTAFAIHTVTSWLFAVTPPPRTGWDSTIFGPYFISGAFVAGLSCLVIAMFVYRNSYNLKDYLNNKLFNKVGKLLVLVSLIYIYFNINEFLVPAYKMKQADKIHLDTLFSGHHSFLFWIVQILGLVIPTLLLLIKKIRKPLPMLVLSIFMILGAWFKRYIIVVPTMEHPYLPIQNVPDYFKFYSPTLIEIAVTIAPILMVLMIISILSKVFPVISIWEIAKLNNNKHTNNEH